ESADEESEREDEARQLRVEPQRTQGSSVRGAGTAFKGLEPADCLTRVKLSSASFFRRSANPRRSRSVDGAPVIRRTCSTFCFAAQNPAKATSYSSSLYARTALLIAT